MALLKGRENASWDFAFPGDGFHRAIFQEGVTLKVNENSGKESLMVPMMIEEDGEDNGVKVSAFINTRDENQVVYKQTEQQIADVIVNAKLYDAFVEKYPDETSWLSPRIIEALKIALPMKPVGIRTKVEASGKDGSQKRCNVKEWAFADADKVKNAVRGAKPVATSASGGGQAAKPAANKAATPGW